MVLHGWPTPNPSVGPPKQRRAKTPDFTHRAACPGPDHDPASLRPEKSRQGRRRSRTFTPINPKQRNPEQRNPEQRNPEQRNPKQPRDS
ncbi:MAG: hypothetical protein DWH99_03290 [Planctomycetota bacterium]|nr:MAG: hypothetical protein DWH99_03290 [Planctomycetota bacterium]